VDGDCKTKVVGAVVGGTDLQLRRRSVAETVRREGVQAVLVAGLGLGEGMQQRAEVLEAVVDELEERGEAALMRVVVGPVGSPAEVLQALRSGVDVMACAYPALMARTGHALVFPLQKQVVDHQGRASKRRRVEGEGEEKEEGEGPGEGGAGSVDGVISLWDSRWRQDAEPLLVACPCPACRRHSKAYIHHLLIAHEILAEVLLYVHNTVHYMRFFEAARESIAEDRFTSFASHVTTVCQQ
jgi:queuine tRNA-ribosyltransferase subunit QTRTD1